jgi:hypothetical protein
MRKTLLVVVVILCGLWGASQAMAGSLSVCDAVRGNIVANCGFETGDFSGWTISGNTANPGGNYNGADAFDAHSGNYGAYMSQDFFVGTTPVDLSQTLTTVAGGQYQVTFWLDQNTAPTTGYTHTFSATWNGTTTMLSLMPTVAVPGPTGVFTEYQFDETATGASTALNFAFENDDSYWSFDDVSAAKTPEPPAGVLTGTALCALLLLRRMAAAE